MLTTTQESSEKWLWYKNEETKTQTEEVNCLNQNQESPARLQCLSSVLLCPKTLMTQHVWQNLGSPVLCRLTSLVAPDLLRWYMNMEVWGLQPGRFHEDIQEPFQKPLSQKCRTFRMLWLNTAFCHQMATWFNLSHLCNRVRKVPWRRKWLPAPAFEELPWWLRQWRICLHWGRSAFDPWIWKTL